MLEICNLIGDYTITTEDFDEETGDIYSMSVNCERIIPIDESESLPVDEGEFVDIGGAHTAVATMIAILTAFMLIN